MSCGVYKIQNNITGRVYIGSSCRIEYRWTDHKRDLRKHIHGNKLLQSDYDMYGLQSFSFEIVEICTDEMKLQREKYYAEEVYKCMNLDGSNNLGYNLAPYINTGFALKQYVPHEKMDSDDVKISKILLSLGFSSTCISQLLNVKHRSIHEIKILYSYTDIYSEYNYFIEHKNPYNVFSIFSGIDEFVAMLDNRFGIINLVKNDLFIKQYPFLPFEIIYDIPIFSNAPIRTGKDIYNNITGSSLYLSDFDVAKGLSDTNLILALIFIYSISRFDNISQKRIASFSEREFAYYTKLKYSHNDYMCMLNYFLKNNYIESDIDNKVFVIPHINTTNEYCKLYNEDDLIVKCNKYLSDIGLAKDNISICSKCGTLFSHNTKRSAFCQKHRGYQKIGISTKSFCHCCGEEVDSNVIMCETCNHLFTYNSELQENGINYD